MSNKRIALLAHAAIVAAAMPDVFVLDNHHREEPPREYLPKEPDQPYRRKKPATEADHEALARAEAKRQRRANRNAAQAQERKP